VRGAEVDRTGRARVVQARPGATRWDASQAAAPSSGGVAGVSGGMAAGDPRRGGAGRP